MNAARRNEVSTIGVEIVSSSSKLNIIPYFESGIIIVGIFGNVCSFLLQMQPAFRASSMSIYMRALAVSDSIALMQVMYRIVNSFVRLDGTADMILCKFGFCLSMFGKPTSVFLLLAMSLDRFIALKFPFKARQLCTAWKAKVTSSILFIVFGILSSLEWLRVHNESRRLNCTYDFPEPFHSIRVNFFLYGVAFVPGILMTFANICIIILLSKHSKKRSKLTDQKNPTKDNSVALMLVTISFTYLVTMLPLRVWTFVRTVYHLNLSREVMELIIDIWLLVEMLNYATNFYLYAFSLKKFRAELFKMLVCAGLKIDDVHTTKAKQLSVTAA